MLINLLKETKEVLKKTNHSVKNIKFIRNAEGYIFISDFVEAAENFNYDNESDSAQVDLSLTIVGKHWWLTRYYREGHEGWEFHLRPTKPELQAVDFLLKNQKK